MRVLPSARLTVFVYVGPSLGICHSGIRRSSGILRNHLPKKIKKTKKSEAAAFRGELRDSPSCAEMELSLGSL
jgi:hypothetical protein